MKRLTFLLLDANVVITLFKLKIWDAVVEQCDIRLSRTVAGESAFYFDDRNTRVDIDLAPYEKSGQVSVFEVPTSAITAFADQFDSTYVDRLDPGEAESLAHLLASAPSDARLCSGDNIVYRVLGNLDRGELGISLEEVLQALGRARKVDKQFTKDFRVKCTAHGVEERIQGTGLRKR